MTPKKLETKSLTEFQIKEVHSQQSKDLQRKPTLSELDKALKATYGMSTSRDRLVAICQQIETTSAAPLTVLSPELTSSMSAEILKFANQAIESHAKSLQDSLETVRVKLANSAKEIDERERVIQSLRDEFETVKAAIVESSNIIDVRDKQINSLQAQLDAKEAAAANVYAQQIAQKIEENLKLQVELESLKQKFIAELTTLVGEAKASQFLEPKAGEAEKPALAS